LEGLPPAGYGPPADSRLAFSHLSAATAPIVASLLAGPGRTRRGSACRPVADSKPLCRRSQAVKHFPEGVE